MYSAQSAIVLLTKNQFQKDRISFENILSLDKKTKTEKCLDLEQYVYYI